MSGWVSSFSHFFQQQHQLDRMCVCAHVCVCACMCAHVCAGARVYTCLCVCACVFAHACMCACVCVCVHTCVPLQAWRRAPETRGLRLGAPQADLPARPGPVFGKHVKVSKRGPVNPAFRHRLLPLDRPLSARVTFFLSSSPGGLWGCSSSRLVCLTLHHPLLKVHGTWWTDPESHLGSTLELFSAPFGFPLLSFEGLPSAWVSLMRNRSFPSVRPLRTLSRP